MKTIIRIQDYVVHLPHFRFLKWGRQEGVEQRRMVAYLDSLQARLASPSGMISLQEMQSQTEEELGALLPSCKGTLRSP